MRHVFHVSNFREAGIPTRLGGKNTILQTSQTEMGWHSFWDIMRVRERTTPHTTRNYPKSSYSGEDEIKRFFIHLIQQAFQKFLKKFLSSFARIIASLSYERVLAPLKF